MCHESHELMRALLKWCCFWVTDMVLRNSLCKDNYIPVWPCRKSLKNTTESLDAVSADTIVGYCRRMV
jgi:hypothetical protein